jgi:hypothetical protein
VSGRGVASIARHGDTGPDLRRRLALETRPRKLARRNQQVIRHVRALAPGNYAEPGKRGLQESRTGRCREWVGSPENIDGGVGCAAAVWVLAGEGLYLAGPGVAVEEAHAAGSGRGRVPAGRDGTHWLPRAARRLAWLPAKLSAPPPMPIPRNGEHGSGGEVVAEPADHTTRCTSSWTRPCRPIPAARGPGESWVPTSHTARG